MLVQEKLNVSKKERSNIFYWRGQFTPQFVEYILSEFSQQDYVILDPFSGSGTILQEAARKKLCAYGFEINPAAYAMSKFFIFSNEKIENRHNLIKAVTQKIIETLPQSENLPIFENVRNFRENHFNLLNFAKALIDKCDSKELRIIALNILFKAENLKSFEITDAIRKSFLHIKKALIELPYTENEINAYLCDARKVNEVLPNKADLIITSPPYINVFNYHQNYRSIIELLNFNLLNVAKSEFGSNRKNRSNRFKTVIQYCLDIEQSLISFWKALNENGKIIMIIGKESNVRRIPFYNGKIVREIIKGIGGFKLLNSEKRIFTNKFGNDIIEDILIFEKEFNVPIQHCGRVIAKNNLIEALNLADGDIKEDLKEAIENIENVKPSPIFNIKNVITNEQSST
jgi:DNA modification methylase